MFHKTYNILCWGVLIKFDVTPQLCSNSDKNNGHFTCRPKCVWAQLETKMMLCPILSSARFTCLWSQTNRSRLEGVGVSIFYLFGSALNVLLLSHVTPGISGMGPLCITSVLHYIHTTLIH